MMLSDWSNFFVMTGTAAAGLTGLMFVVISLINDEDRTTNLDDMDVGVSAYSTPVVMHLTSAFFFSALLVVPWRSLLPLSIIVVLIALWGDAFLIWVTRRARRARTSNYEPDLEDFMWYTVLPLCTYVLVIVAAILMNVWSMTGVTLVAAGVLLLILIGIHNAWDIVTYLAVYRRRQQ